MTAETDLLPLPEPVAYANPLAFRNFKKLGHLGGPYGREWMWAKPDAGLVPLYTGEQVRACVSSATEALRAERDAAIRGEHRTDDTQPTWAELVTYWRASAERAEAQAAELRKFVDEFRTIANMLESCLA